MGLDIKLKALLTMAKLNAPKPLETMLPDEARKTQKRSINLGRRIFDYPDQPLHEIRDITISVQGGQIELRLYRPSAKNDLGIVVYFHGGGFVVGDLDTHDNVCRRIAYLSDCLVVSVNYRRAPEYRFPTPPEDCFAATCWVYENGTLLGGNPQKMVLAGDSAGGNLATVVCMMLRDRNMALPICKQVLIYPVTDATQSCPSVDKYKEGYMLTKPALYWYTNHYVSPTTDLLQPYLSPLFAKDLSNLPPALIITAEFDPLIDEGERYAKRLQEAGIVVVLKRYMGVIHGFFHMPRLLKHANEAQHLVAGEIRKAVYYTSGTISQ